MADNTKIAEVKQPTHVQIAATDWNEIMSAIANNVVYAQAAPILEKMQKNGKPITIED